MERLNFLSFVDAFLKEARVLFELADDKNLTCKRRRDFKRNSEKLETLFESFKEHHNCSVPTVRFGMSAKKESDIMSLVWSLLSETSSEVGKLQLKLPEKANTLGCQVFPCSRESSFPPHMGQSILRLNEALHDILEEKKSKIPPKPRSSLSFRKDNRYVRLEKTEKDVLHALEDCCGPLVVFLHGGAGKGKSSVARVLALHFETAVMENESMFKTYDVDGPMSPTIFDEVVYLDCGPNLQPESKQLELLELLGCDTSILHERRSLGLDQKFSFNASMRRELSARLRSARLLLIFNDLWSKNLLQTIADLCGDKVKCLVTSQLGNLCDGLNCKFVPVRIEDINLPEARKILAAHIGISDNCIPPQIEDLADEIINRVDANPLAMACIATAIDPKRSGEARVWRRLLDQLSKYVFEVDSGAIAHIHGKQYPRSYWDAMQMAFEHLTEQQKSLLVIASLCKGHPEEVIKFLYRKLKNPRFSGFETFSKARRQLEARQLIRIDTQANERSWSVHSLWRMFIDQTKEDEKNSVVSTVLHYSSTTFELEPEADMVKVIGFLYFKDQFAGQISQQLSIHQLGNLDPSTMLSRRDAMEPMLRHLALDVRHHEASSGFTSARRVFLRYICRGELDQGNIHILLLDSKASCAMLTSLSRLALMENIDLGDNILKDVLMLFTHKSVSSVASIRDLMRRDSASVLSNLARRDDDDIKAAIVDYPGALEQLVLLLDGDDDSRCQTIAARALANLACGSASIALKIINFPSALESLVTVLSKNGKDVPNAAAKALVNLTTNRDACVKFVQCPGALDHLVQGLRRDDNAELREHMAAVCAHLAIEGDICSIVVDFAGVLEELVRALSTDGNPGLAKEAASALSNIALRGGELSFRVFEYPGVSLERLLWASVLGQSEIQRMRRVAAFNLSLSRCWENL